MSSVTDPFDPVNLALPLGSIPTTNGKRWSPRQLPGEWFLRGPIPWAWIAAASALPGKALAVGLIVWRESGARGHALTVPVNLSRSGLPRRTAQRALQALAQAGLVTVEHRDGRPPLVTLVTPSSP